MFNSFFCHLVELSWWQGNCEGRLLTRVSIENLAYFIYAFHNELTTAMLCINRWFIQILVSNLSGMYCLSNEYLMATLF